MHGGRVLDTLRSTICVNMYILPAESFSQDHGTPVASGRGEHEGEVQVQVHGEEEHGGCIHYLNRRGAVIT